jgi:hypothetical protein
MVELLLVNVGFLGYGHIGGVVVDRNSDEAIKNHVTTHP